MDDVGRGPTAVVLAAGGSRRMGQPKALLDWAGRALVAAHVEALAQVADAIAVVVGADADAVEAVLPPGTRAVRNPDWSRTAPADSLRLALDALAPQGAVLVTPVDVAPARPETLRALLAAGAPAVPTTGSGRAGHPVLLDPDLVRAVRDASPPGGLRALLASVRRVAVEDPLVADDFDDPEAWARLRPRRREDG